MYSEDDEKSLGDCFMVDIVVVETAVVVGRRKDEFLICRGGDAWVLRLVVDAELRVGAEAIVVAGRDVGKPRGEIGILSSWSVFSEQFDTNFSAVLSAHTVESPSFFSMRVWRLCTEA